MFDISCPQCGADVVLVNGFVTGSHRAGPIKVGLRSTVIVACGPCRRQFEVTAIMSTHSAVDSRPRKPLATRTVAR